MTSKQVWRDEEGHEEGDEEGDEELDKAGHEKGDEEGDESRDGCPAVCGASYTHPAQGDTLQRPLSSSLAYCLTPSSPLAPPPSGSLTSCCPVL